MQHHILTKIKKVRKEQSIFFAEAILFSSQYACINITEEENIAIAEDIAKTYNVSFNLASDEFLYIVIKKDFNHKRVLKDYDNNNLIPDHLTLITYIEDNGLM